MRFTICVVRVCLCVVSSKKSQISGTFKHECHEIPREFSGGREEGQRRAEGELVKFVPCDLFLSCLS